MELPFTAANRVQFPAPVKIERVVRALRVALVCEQRPDVEAVNDTVFSRFGPGEPRNRRQQINRHRRLANDYARRNLAGPPRHEGLAYTALKSGSLAFAQPQSLPGVIAVAQPGAVVRREDHQSISIQIQPLQRVEDLADRPIDLLDHIAVQP